MPKKPARSTATRKKSARSKATPKKSARSKASPATKSPVSLLFGDLEQEFATTRRMLERVPNGQSDWRPHEKSTPLDKLATHLAQLPGFGIMIITQDGFDTASGRTPQPKPADSAERLKLFEMLSAQMRRLIEGMTWDQAMAPWTFRSGERVVRQVPRAEALRAFVLTHSTHHRAQLGVYLRLLGIPIPGSYGPSADEA
jgi:uncharacterized damage-inducible protein DinB